MYDDQRRRLFVDPAVQGVLIARAILYWAFCLLTITLILLIYQAVTDWEEPLYDQFLTLWSTLRAPMAASLLVLCLVLIDLVRLSNRFTGPMCRLRREMCRLAMGDDVKPVHFRDDDFWPELSVHFNAIAARLRAAEKVDLAKASLANASPAAPECEDIPSDPGEQHFPIDVRAPFPAEEPAVASIP